LLISKDTLKAGIEVHHLRTLRLELSDTVARVLAEVDRVSGDDSRPKRDARDDRYRTANSPVESRFRRLEPTSHRSPHHEASENLRSPDARLVRRSVESPAGRISSLYSPDL